MFLTEEQLRILTRAFVHPNLKSIHEKTTCHPQTQMIYLRIPLTWRQMNDGTWLTEGIRVCTVLTPEIAHELELTILHAIIDRLERPRLSMKTAPSNNDKPRVKNLTKPKKFGM